MKILHVELGRHLYGGARQVAYLLNGLAVGDHRLLCASGSAIESAMINPNVSVVSLPFSGDADLCFLRRLQDEIKAFQPDLMHLHSRRGDMLVTLAASMRSVPIICSRRVDNPPRWMDLRFKFPRYQRIITISEGIRTVLLKAGLPAQRVVCVQSAVDTDRYQPDKAARSRLIELLGEAPIGPVIGVAAQLIKRKGHAVLLDGMPELLARIPDVSVVCFGQGPEEQSLRNRIEHMGLQRNIKLVGFCQNMQQLLPGLDLLVHPAYMEGLGVALLEAAACGIPIVASRVGGIPEIVIDGVTGYLVPPGLSEPLVEAIASILLDEAGRLEMGRHARTRVETFFSIKRMIEGNLEVYAEELQA